MAAALDGWRPDVVAVPGWSDPAALAALAWCRARRAAAVLMSDSSAADAPRTFAREAVKRLVVCAAGAGFVAGTPQRAYLSGLGMPPERITLGYDVVDNAHFAAGADAARADADAVRAALGLPKRYVLFVGRLIARKNGLGLLDGYARHLAGGRAPTLSLVIVGDGPERAAISARIAELGLGAHVQLRPFAQYDELPKLYGLARALIVPSLADPWGLVVNEAMASGLLVLASTACGSAPDLVVEGITGHTFAPGDADAIARAFEQTASAAAMARLGRAARAHIAAWDLERFVAGIEAAAGAARTAPRRSTVPVPVLRLIASAAARG
jgi:glycosyltransferase involved in cell wall biosynthesis